MKNTTQTQAPTPRYWLAVATKDNCAALSAAGYPYYALTKPAKINPGDYCVSYRSGKGKARGFIGIFKFSSAPEPANIKLGDDRQFSIRIPWEALAMCDNDPVLIIPLIPDLELVGNKSYYSMALRQSIRVISESDFRLIAKKIKAKLKQPTRTKSSHPVRHE